MNEIRIEEMQGEAARPVVDEFYKRNGSNGRAKENDLFFVAYSKDQIVGCVRLCAEEETWLLRTMYIDFPCRQQGIGRILLKAFGRYLDNNNIKNVFCLPHSHLEKFYGLINFKTVEEKEVPPFLIDRAKNYAQNGLNTIFMKRL